MAATVAAAAALPGVDIVIVTDDGSTDVTAQLATAAGAVVVTHTRTRGRAAAIESAVNALGVLEQRDRRPECGTLLILDAGLGASAARCAPMLTAVRDGAADLVIGVPPNPEAGLVATTAARGISELTGGWTTRAPVSGPRCLTRRAFELASPLAAGWGAELGMSIDIVKAGLRVRRDGCRHRSGRPPTERGRPAGTGGPIARRHPRARGPRPGAGQAEGVPGRFPGRRRSWTVGSVPPMSAGPQDKTDKADKADKADRHHHHHHGSSRSPAHPPIKRYARAPGTVITATRWRRSSPPRD